MKKISTILAFFLVMTMGYSQALDFTFTDTNGESHTLSEALAEGKVIILDFFFVDCPPCNTWGPEIDKIAEDFEGTTLEVWALSDRDSDDYIKGSIFNPTHPNHFVGGTAGGGAEVVDLYADAPEFNFLGFPTYSVICNDNSITWDLWPLTPGVEEIRSLLTVDCGVVDLMPSDVKDIKSLEQVQVYPNPVADMMTLDFNLSEATDLNINLFNTLGQQVQAISSQNYASGNQVENVNVKDLAQGLYFVQIQSEEGVQNIEVVIGYN